MLNQNAPSPRITMAVVPIANSATLSPKNGREAAITQVVTANANKLKPATFLKLVLLNMLITPCDLPLWGKNLPF